MHTGLQRADPVINSGARGDFAASPRSPNGIVSLSGECAMAINGRSSKTPQWRLDADIVDSVTIRGVEDIRGAAVALNDAAHACAFRIAVAADIASKEPMMDADGGILNADVFGWVADGERWWEDTRLALKSFLPRACRYESEPFWYNEHGFHTHWRNKYLEGISIKDFKMTRTSRSAILIPVHLSFGQIGAVSLIPHDRETDDLSEPFRLYGDSLGLLVRRFVASYVAAVRTQQWIPSNCSLSKREVECLRWAAIGKTDNDISAILSLSHATVRYHVQRAGEKLNAVNRSQAVFKAGQLGFLGAAS
jgi:DNA-binding CsgD family transcriptional regulator